MNFFETETRKYKSVILQSPAGTYSLVTIIEFFKDEAAPDGWRNCGEVFSLPVQGENHAARADLLASVLEISVGIIANKRKVCPLCGQAVWNLYALDGRWDVFPRCADCIEDLRETGWQRI